jgi:large repetitive protein
MRLVAIPMIFVALGVAAAQTPAPQTPTRTTAPGIGQSATPENADAFSSIEGRVIAADTGTPLRGASVRISGTGARTAMINKTAVTDRQGRYRLDDVVPGPYMIFASRPGFVQMRAAQKHPLERVAMWTVPSSTTDRLDFALPRGGVIAGRLTDQNGEPLEGIRMITFRVIHQPHGDRLSRGTPMHSQTDDRGEFRVAGLSPGIYLLSAEIQSNETGHNLVTTYYPGTTDRHEAGRLKIGLSEQVNASFSMWEGRLVRISGQIRASDGTPLHNARLALRTHAEEFGRTGRVEDPSGQFEISGVAPGDYILDVSRSGPGGMPDFFKQAEFASIKLSVGTEDLTGLVITTGTGLTVAGRVIYEGAASPTAPPPRVFVRTEVLDGRPGMRPPASDETNGMIAQDSTFTIKGGYGKMLFNVFQPDWMMKSVMLNGIDITDVPYDSSRGNIKDLEIVITDKKQELIGTVTDALGKTAHRYAVVVFRSNLPEGAVPGRFIRLLSPQPDGMFRINNLPSGDYLAAAVETAEQDSQWDPAFREALKPRSTPFRLSPGQTTKIELALIE